MTANTQCKRSAVAGLCSRVWLRDGQNLWLSQVYGVVVLRAKNSDHGRIPSFAISCFTVGEVRVNDLVPGDIGLGKSRRPYLSRQ